MEPLEESALSKNQLLLLAALLGVIFLVVFNYTLTIIASTYIVGDLGGSNDIAIYTITFFSLGNALSIPLSGPLSNRIGTVKLLVILLLAFAFLSWLCASANNYPFFIASRFFQGLVSGPFYILVNNILFAFISKEMRAKITPIFISIFIAGPALGASWGGWIAYDLNWRCIFYVNFPFSLFLAWYFSKKIKKFKFDLAPLKIPFDQAGYFFYFIGIFCLSFILTTGQQFDWFRSHWITVFALAGTISFIFFVLWEISHPHPILDFGLFKKLEFSFAMTSLAVLFSTYFGMIILLALWLNLYVNYTPIWIGVVVGGIALAALLPTILFSKRELLRDCRIHMLIGIILFALSSFHTSYYNEEINFGRIAFSRISAGFALAFLMTPIFRLSFKSFPEEKTNNIISILQIVRALSSGLGASFYSTLWQRRRVFYHDRLGSKITAFSQETQEYFSNAKTFDLQGIIADAKLEDLLDRQATALALDDVFYLMAWIMVGLLVLLGLTLLYRRGNFCPEKIKNTEVIQKN